MRRAPTAAVLAAIVAAGLAWALSLNYLSDDAFISFRYARNLARGEGLVFNPGERVEGYTSFLEIVVLAAAHRLGAELVGAGRALSLVSGAAAVLLAWMLARRGLRRWPPLALFSAGLVAANPYVAAWAGAGLETTLFAALLAASVLPLLSREVTRGPFLAASGLALLLSLTRPEGVVLYGLLAALSATAARGDLKARAGALAPGLALFAVAGGLYFGARWLYFGDVLPNTFYAKGAFTLRHVQRGLVYLRDFGRNPFALCALPLVAAGLWAALRRHLALLAAVPLAVLAIVVAEGGDGLPMYRFVVPVLPFVAALAALGWEVLGERLGPRLGLGLGATLAAAALTLSFFPNGDRQLTMYVYQRDHEVPQWSAVGRALAASFPRGTTVALVPIGAVGYYSDLRVLDMLGLTDRTVARAVVADMGSAWAGHEKHDGAYVLSRRPEILLLGNVYVDSQPSLPPGVFAPYGAEAILARERDIIAQPAFAAEYEMRHLAVGPDRWLHYFARRDLPQTRSSDGRTNP
jgi:arabinofuranosyltransferase